MNESVNVYAGESFTGRVVSSTHLKLGERVYRDSVIAVFYIRVQTDNVSWKINQVIICVLYDTIVATNRSCC